jgi:hypothetical protein
MKEWIEKREKEAVETTLSIWDNWKAGTELQDIDVILIRR